MNLDSIRKRLKSRTYWLGIGVHVLAMLLLVQDNMASLNIPAKYVGIAGIVLGAAIYWLRELTTKPVSDK